MKNLFFLAMLLCIAHTTNAQCPNDPGTDDVRAIPISIKTSHQYFTNNGETNLIYAANLEVCKSWALHNEVHFLPFLNLESSDHNIRFNFGDGSPEVTLEDGQMVEHTYPVNATGVNVDYQIKITWTNPPPDGDYYSTIDQDPFTIKASTSFNSSGYTPPDETWEISSSATYSPPVQGAFPPGSQFNGNALGGAHAYIKYAPAHNGKLLKPLIFVDGIDFNSKTYTYNGEIIRHGSTGWDVLVMGNDASQPNPYDVDVNGNTVPSEFSYYPTAFNTFMSEPNNYDIIFLDFGEGTDWIQKNGLELVELIKRVNERKALYTVNGETVCDNAVIGASMGGQVAKWALSYMEENNLNHQCHTYVSFDSPHRGANIPFSIQSFAYLAHLSGLDTDDNWARLNAPAARQMLITSLESSFSDGGFSGFGDVGIGLEQFDACYLDPYRGSVPVTFNFPNSLAIRQGFESEMSVSGYPQMTRNVAISCGTHTGEKLPIANGELCFAANRYLDLTGYANNHLCDLTGDVAEVNMAIIGGASIGINEMLGICVNSGGIDGGCFNADVPAASNCIFRGFLPNIMGEISGNEVPQGQLLLTVTDVGVLPALDNAPGCKRNDLNALRFELEDLGFTVSANLGYTSFMPTLSLLDIQWPMDDEHLIMPFDPDDPAFLAQTPFDAVFAPDENLRHIELTPAMVNWVIGQLTLGLTAAQSLNLTSGQTFNYGKRKNRVPDVTINNGASLAVNLTGNINYMTPQDPVADKPHFDVYTGGGCNQGKTVTVKNGGILQIGDPGSSKTGFFHALEQSVIRVESGGTLRISNASTLRIYHGATLILDAGAIVRLDSPGSSITINGDLVVNGDIVFGGLGYFHFAEGNQLVFGPGYNTFNLTGAGKDKRFVYLSADVLIDNGHRLNWRLGLLEAANGTLLLTDGSGLDFNFMTLTGGDNGNLTVIEATGSGAVKLQGCKVEKLVMPIFGTGGFGCSIIACEFSQYFVGVLWETGVLVTVTGSIFDGGSNPGTSAFQMKDVPFMLLSDDQFFGHLDPSIAGIVTDGDLNQGIPAVNLDNMVACLVKGCSFTNNSIGIKSDNPATATTANVYAYGATGFYHNEAGIYLVGGVTQGTVLADCVTFDQNRNGIRGRDITLMIDSWNSNIFAFDSDSPNHFIRMPGGGPGATESHVRICYQLKAAGGSNLMRNNFWGITTGGVPVADPMPLGFLFLLDAACTTSVAAPMLQPIASRNTSCPLDQRPESFATPFSGSECMLSVGSGGTTGNPIRVHEQFHLGTFLMKSDSVEAGIETMRPVAALWQSEMSGYTANCQQYIQVAKAFVDASDNMLPELQRPSGERTKVSTQGSLIISPNPANGSAMVHLSPAVHQLRVWDAQGNLCQQVTASDSYRLETATWQSGIYFVETVAADGSRRSGKLVIQR
ncbi:MAG: T9SS type A sorting domain-containing protein [Saprospiraceae bacterium]